MTTKAGSFIASRRGAKFLQTGLTTFWLVSAPILGLLYMMVRPSPDQSEFDYIGWLALHGMPYYSGSFDMNWPGAMMLHEAGIWLFGVHFWTFRLTDFLLMEMLNGAIAVLIWRSGFRTAPFMFIALYPMIYVSGGGWMVGQRDIIATGIILAAGALATPGYAHEKIQTSIAGVLIAAAVLVRPTFLSFLAGLLLLEMLPVQTLLPRHANRRTRAILLVAGFSATVGIVVAVGVIQGNLGDWYEKSIVFALSAYSGSPAQSLASTAFNAFIRWWHWLTILGSIGLVLWVKRDGLAYGPLIVIGAAGTIIISFVAQNKGFGYHIGGFLTLLTLLVAVCLDSLLNIWRKRRTLLIGTAVIAALGITVSGCAKKLTHLAPSAENLLAGRIDEVFWGDTSSKDLRSMVNLIRAGSQPGDYIVLYSNAFEIPFLSERRSSIRLTNTPALGSITPSFPYYENWLTQLETDLREKPPVFVILGRNWLDGIDTPLKASPTAPKTFRTLMKYVGNRYEVLYVANHDILLKRREGS